jgi:hypothetical protein
VTPSQHCGPRRGVKRSCYFVTSYLTLRRFSHRSVGAMFGASGDEIGISEAISKLVANGEMK